MPSFIDLTGKRFDRLKVLERGESEKGRSVKWNCLCDCGNTVAVDSYPLRKGITKSCGCLHNETTSVVHTTHGLSSHDLYHLFYGMKARCYNKKSNSFKWYGGRGITICQAWLEDFKTFYNWAMENGYEPNLTIDRKDNDKNYTPSNCQWITQSENSVKQRGCKNKKNTSGHYGVYLTAAGNWSTQIRVGIGKTKFLGTFKSKKAAADAITEFKKENQI